MWLDFGTPKMINFPFGTNGKFVILGVILILYTYLKHITVYKYTEHIWLVLVE